MSSPPKGIEPPRFRLAPPTSSSQTLLHLIKIPICRPSAVYSIGPQAHSAQVASHSFRSPPSILDCMTGIESIFTRPAIEKLDFLSFAEMHSEGRAIRVQERTRSFKFSGPQTSSTSFMTTTWCALLLCSWPHSAVCAFHIRVVLKQWSKGD